MVCTNYKISMNINSRDWVQTFFLYWSLQMNINLKYLGIKIYDIDQCILTWKKRNTKYCLGTEKQAVKVCNNNWSYLYIYREVYRESEKLCVSVYDRN